MLIIGIGGTMRPGSSSETALLTALQPIEEAGAEVRAFTATDLDMPMYDPSAPERVGKASAFIEAVEAADGIVLSSPGYHGTVSGLIKNALDYVEDLRDTPRAYFDGRAVGCIAVAYGWQGAVTTMQDLRGIVHALRGWPTPYGATVNAAMGVFRDGACTDESVRGGLRLVGSQVLAFAEAVSGRPLAAEAEAR